MSDIINFLNSNTIYEVNVRQYTPAGTFTAFMKSLPRLKKMGIKILWFMPITPISLKKRLNTLGSYYACSSYTAINPEFGNLEDFKLLVNQAHLLGFKVIIDWVANHTGYDHEWTVKHKDWYIKDADGNFTEKNGWTDVIDLDYSNHKMQEEMIRCMEYWIQECDIDGFRCDMAHLVPLSFWQKAKLNCDKLKPLFWLGEFENTEYHHVFNVSYAWWWMKVTKEFQQKQASLQDIIQVLHSYSQYPHAALKLYFTTNHDENSWNGTEIEKYSFNALLWSVFSFTWIRGVPLIYSGQEIPNTKRLKFFEKDCIDWHQPLKNEHFYSSLIHLKNKNKALHGGEVFILPTEDDNILAYLRKNEFDIVLVLLNFADTDNHRITVKHQWLQGHFKNLFNDLEFHLKQDEIFEMSAHQYIVYYKV